MKYVALAALVFTLIFLATYWAGNGFSASDGILTSADGFYIRIDQPASGSSYTQANTLVIRGGSVGGTLQKAILWDQAYNVGIPCNVLGTTFAVEIDAAQLSPGGHTLVIQAQATDGRWSAPASIDITITPLSSSPEPSYSETEGDPLAFFFQPIYDIIDGVSLSAEEGTGDNDLNGDNIDDRLQSSPVSPRYNALNLPLTLMVIVVIIGLILFLIIYYFYRYRSVESLHQLHLTRHLSETPDKRRWYLKLQELKPKQVSKQLVELRQMEKSLHEKTKRIQAREDALLEQQIRLKRQEQSTVTLGRLISTAIGKRAERIDAQQRKLLEQQALFKKQATIHEQVLQTTHSLSVDQLQRKKIALQKKILAAKQQNASDRALRHLSSKISTIEGRITTMKGEYERQLAGERKARELQRKRFGRVLSRLRKEKEELSKQKSVKIFIGAKKKRADQTAVRHSQRPSDPRRRPVPMYPRRRDTP